MRKQMISARTIRSACEILVLVLVPFLVAFVLRECSGVTQDNKRLSDNQDVLLHNGKVRIGQLPSGRSVASVAAVQLTSSELGKKPDSLLARTTRELKIKTGRVMAASTVPAATQADVVAPIDGRDSVRQVSWSDAWVSLQGTIDGDTLKAHIESRDTLQMIVHRVPRRFLFFRFGTKAVRMEVVSQNPHTRLSYPKFLTVKK